MRSDEADMLSSSNSPRLLLALVAIGLLAASSLNAQTDRKVTKLADGVYDGKRLVVHADEKSTAFLELESAIRAASP